MQQRFTVHGHVYVLMCTQQTNLSLQHSIFVQGGILCKKIHKINTKGFIFNKKSNYQLANSKIKSEVAGKSSQLANMSES